MPIGNREAHARIGRTLAASSAVCVLVAVWAAAASQPVSPHHGFLGGPWEVLVKMGLEGTALRLPLSVADENKPQALQAAVPVVGTPIQVKLEQYLPDLKWETTAVDDPNGGPVSRLSLRGAGLQQDLWLCARDRERQSVTAQIGSVAMREVPEQAEDQILQKLAEPSTVGIVLVWLTEKSPPLVYPAQPGQAVTLAGTPWKLSVLRYVPHYSIDRQTRKVTSQSDKPENPAVEIRVKGGTREYRQWLWSLFASSPHQKQQLPFRARFVDFHLGGAGRYLLAARGARMYVLYEKDGKKHVEPVEAGKRYPLQDAQYSFAVEETRPAARIKTMWKNGSEMLLHPAVVATIAQGQAQEQVVLEIGQPYHHKTMFGTLVALYRHVP